MQGLHQLSAFAAAVKIVAVLSVTQVSCPCSSRIQIKLSWQI